MTSCGQGFLFSPCSNNELRVASYELRVTSLRVTSFEVRVMKLRVTSYDFTGYELRVMSYELRVTSRVFSGCLYGIPCFFFINPNSILNWPKFHGIMRNYVLRE